MKQWIKKQRAKVETSKKQRLERISAEYQAMVRTVKFGDETLHTMDEYQHDLQLDDHINVDMWMEEEKDDLAADGQTTLLTDVLLRQTNPLTGSLTVSSSQDYVA